jgi:glycerol-3-phosphate dehydrogenase
MFRFWRKRPEPPSLIQQERAEKLERLAGERFDILIVGGGITGAAVARDASLRGLRVVLIEKGDFASGTSSRSSKLVHGGFRYLHGRHVRLVRESLRERGILLRIAPHLVHPAAFYLPVFAGGHDGRLKLRLGLTAYDLLAGFGADIGRHAVLSRDQILEAEPLLNPEGLQGGFRYYDCLVNDARLTLTTIRSAVESGALALNYVEAAGLQWDGDKVVGVTFREKLTGKEGVAFAKTVVNATGPWADQLREMAGVKGMLKPTKGIHLVLSRSRLPLSALTILPYADRFLFGVPRGDSVYVGTTDTFFDADPADAAIETTDVAYVLDVLNARFPSVNATEQDITASWAGVRPLVAEEGSPLPSDVSRDFEMTPGPEGFYTIAGGKLTTARAMAESLVNRLVEREGARNDWQATPCRTAGTPLFGGNIDGFDRYAPSAAAALAGGWNLPPEAASRLVQTYGTEHVRLLGVVRRDASLLRPLSEGCPVLAVEAVYAAEQEMALTLQDFMERRTELMLFDPQHGLDSVRQVADLMGDVLGWSRRERDRQVALYWQAVARMTSFVSARPPAPVPAEAEQD